MSDSPTVQRPAPARRNGPRTPLPQLERILRERGVSGTRFVVGLGYAKQVWSQNQQKGWPLPVARAAADALGVSLDTLTTAGPPPAGGGPSVAALLNHADVALPYSVLQSTLATAVDQAVRDIAVAVAGLVAGGTIDGRAVVADARAVTEAQLARARALRSADQAEPAQRRSKARR